MRTSATLFHSSPVSKTTTITAATTPIETFSPPATIHRSTWQSPVPYLFGGLAAMLGLIAFALLILACSYWKLSGRVHGGDDGVGDAEKGDGGPDTKTSTFFEEKFLVIMAGDLKPTFLATPTTSRASSSSSFTEEKNNCKNRGKELEIEKPKNQNGSDLLIPAQESYFLLRILNGSFQTLESLKDQITLYFNQFLCSKSSLDLIESRSISSDQNEKKEISDGEQEPRGAVFNALDAMLKDNLDRLKTMRESIGWGHTHRSDAILETNYGSDIYTIRILCLEGKLGTALWLWKTVVQQHGVPDVVTHNYLLNAHCKSGYLGRAEWLVKEMLCHGPSPTCATYNTLMKGYCLVNKVGKALDLFSTMANHGIRPNRVSCNILVHALCQKGLLEDSKRLLEKILDDNNDGETSNLITTTILMDGYFKTGNMVEALTCWNDVYQRGIKVDVVAYNVIIHGYCLSGNISLVYKSLSEMFKSGFLPDIFTFNTLISKLCKSDRIDEACYVFSVMPRMGVPPDHVTYKMIIQGLCISGDVIRAHRFLFHMLENSFIPKPLLWNVIINAYGKCGQVQNALSVKNQMFEFGILPNVYTYNALIHTQIRNGNIDKAHYLKKEMLLIGVFPDIVTYNLLIGAACDLGLISSALQLHDEMLRGGCKPDIITYTRLLKCYCMRSKMLEAEELFSKVQMSDLPIDHVPFMILMKKCFKMGELDKVFDLYLIWLRRGN
ncbi:hypothetical protein DH2020_036504 [Rehmannia glutinosa]|uniref:Pentatricopeptide repeat-containing protein n=1 Tax=Rehmannia glutinosa TaxID=99300 RepID=A0ABR0V4P4_REHGL